MRRKLGGMEQALTFTDEFGPFNVAVILQIDGRLEEPLLRQTLDHLQQRHPALRARITHDEGRSFVYDVTTPLELKIISRTNADGWIAVAEDALNSAIDAASGPLAYCIYLQPSATDSSGELLFIFHHAIIDASCGTHLLHESLSLYTTLSQGEMPSDDDTLPIPPAADQLFPAGFRGLNMRRKSAAFMLGQLPSELRYRMALRRHNALKIPPAARVQILPYEMDAEFTTALSRTTRRQRVTLNSVIQAAMLMAVHQQQYKHHTLPMRTFVFSDIRPFLVPPVEAAPVASYIAMSWLDVVMNDRHDLWELAQHIQDQIYRAARHGDKYIAYSISKRMMQMTLRAKAFRMGNTALTYTGAALLDTTYGSIHVRGLHAFISNITLGPEFSIRGGIFDGRLSLDIFTLDTDFSRDEVQQMTEALHTVLRDAIAAHGANSS